MRHISFVVVASLERAEYAVRMERTWMHSAANRIYLVDALIPGLPPSFQMVMNDGAQRGHKDGVAMSRLMIWMNQVKQMYSVGSLPADMRWLVILGDDVYINTARLYYFLAGHASRDDHPVIFAHVLSDTEVYDFDVPCTDSAIALSRSALARISQHASCKTCPYTGSNAISLAYCALYTAVPLVHVPGFRCQADGVADEADVLTHHWIATGGLSKSTLGQNDDGLHPFESDFPNLQCELPPSDGVWTYQQLAERIRFCKASQAKDAAEQPPTLSHGSELSPETLEDYFQARWPGSVDNLEEILVGDIAKTEFLVDHWYFLASAGMWLHRAAVGNFLQDLDYLPPHPDLVFAYVDHTDDLALAPPWILNGRAAQRLQQPLAGGAKLTPALLKKLGMKLVHTPLFSQTRKLPRSLTGAVSAGALSGIWCVVDGDEWTRQDLQLKADDRRFYAGLLQENFEDLTEDQCSDESLRRAQLWQRFLHNDDEHIKVVRGFQSGRREFRTLHAMYRSKVSDTLPLRGVLQDTVLMETSGRHPSTATMSTHFSPLDSSAFSLNSQEIDFKDTQLRLVREQTANCIKDLNALRTEVMLLKSEQKSDRLNSSALANSLEGKQVEVQEHFEREKRERAAVLQQLSRKVNDLERELPSIRDEMSLMREQLRSMETSWQPHVQDLHSTFLKDVEARHQAHGQLEQKIAEIDAGMTRHSVLHKDLQDRLQTSVHQEHVEKLGRELQAHVAKVSEMQDHHINLRKHLEIEKETKNKALEDLTALISQQLGRNLSDQSAPIKDRLDYLEKLMGDSAASHARDLAAAHQKIQDHSVQSKGHAEEQKARQVSLASRVEFLEKSLGDSAAKHGQELLSAHQKITDLHGLTEHSERKHSSLQERVDFIESLLGDNAQKHSEELKKTQDRVSELRGKLGVGIPVSSGEKQVTVESRLKYLEQALGDSDAKHREEPMR
eukprot:s2194_g12.t1